MIRPLGIVERIKYWIDLRHDVTQAQCRLDNQERKIADLRDAIDRLENQRDSKK